MEFPIIKTNNTIDEQLDKIFEEYNEVKSEVIKNDKFHGDMESLDLLTAVYNYVEMLGIPKSTYDKWRSKMIRYQYEKGYEIEKWINLEEENNEEERTLQV